MKPFTTAAHCMLPYQAADKMPAAAHCMVFFHQIYYVLQEVSIIMRNQVSNSE